MTPEELDALKARIAKAEAARDLALRFCKVANDLVNRPGSSVEIGPGWVRVRWGEGVHCLVEFDATELRSLVLNELVTRQIAANKEFQDA